MSASLYWTEALNDPDLNVTIYGGKVNAKGFLMDVLTLDSSVQWESPLDSIADSLMDAGQEAIASKFGGGRAGVLSTGMGMLRKAAPVAKPKWMSTKNWLSTSGPGLNLNLLFVALKDTDDVTLPLKSLANAVYPGGNNIAQTPPNDYIYGQSSEPSSAGTLSVKIGSWFHAKNLYLIDSMTPTFSKQVILNGKPLYCQVQVQMSPYRMIDIDEYQALFV